jgi:hypothetical protein
VSFGDDTLVVDLEDGRQISAPLAWFPRLTEALSADRKGLDNWRLIGNGIGIHWPDLDEDISVVNLLTTRDELRTYHEDSTHEERVHPLRRQQARPRAPRPNLKAGAVEPPATSEASPG